MEIEEVSEVWANILSSIFGLGFGVPLLLGEGIGSITGSYCLAPLWSKVSSFRWDGV